MRFAQVTGYTPSFPVTYQNMYGDGSMVTAGFADPFHMQRREEHSHCPYVVAYNGVEEPRYQLNNPAYIKEVVRSHSDPLPLVALSRNSPQNDLYGAYGRSF
jgi:hypothetical protein